MTFPFDYSGCEWSLHGDTVDIHTMLGWEQWHLIKIESEFCGQLRCSVMFSDGDHGEVLLRRSEQKIV